MKKNAIILAAGKSSNFAPFIYEKPKGLFCVKGEILIERQIRQLQEAGVFEIYVVVGYMKEKFFYLEQKYNIKLISNNTFATHGNIYSLYAAKQYLNNTFVCCADQYFNQNPFFDDNYNNVSYRACTLLEGKFNEFGAGLDEQNRIAKFTIGGSNSLAMVGHAYFNSDFSSKFISFLENEINDFGVGKMFWEEFWAKHIEDLTFFSKIYNSEFCFEFDSLDDLIKFDAEFLLNIDSKIIENICNTLKCNSCDIKEIQTINAGLTNVSFSFKVDKQKYVYRHPGWTADNLVNRATELYTQTVAKENGIDKSFIAMGNDGWKMSYFVDSQVKCNFKSNRAQRKVALSYLSRIHNADITSARLLLKTFDPIDEAMKLLSIASGAKGDLLCEFGELINKTKKLYEIIKNSNFAKTRKKVLCHNDVYEPNYLATKNGDFYLIDWEYAGLNDAAYDLACIFCRDSFSDAMIDEYIIDYLGREPSFEEKRYFWAYIPICGFYWFCWGLYKGSVGDDDGFFFLPAYRNCMKYLQKAINSYERELAL